LTKLIVNYHATAKIRMSFTSFTTYHKVNAQSITKLGDILLSETLCYTLSDLVLQIKA